MTPAGQRFCERLHIGENFSYRPIFQDLADSAKHRLVITGAATSLVTSASSRIPNGIDLHGGAHDQARGRFHEDWIAARKKLLAKEKEFTRLCDQLSAQRRALPWERVDKSYMFETEDGRRSLAQLFAGRSQLVIYHFMLAPDWQEGCKSCSFWADNFNGIDVHLAQRDVTFLAVSRAPLPNLLAFKQRTGWNFK